MPAWRMRRGRERGASLVELLVSMLLLTVALLGLAAAVPLAIHGVAIGGARTTATFLARQAVDVVRTAGYAVLGGLDTGGFVDVPGHAGFSRAIVVAPGVPAPRTTTVTVVVRTTSGTGVPDTALTTVRAE